MADVLERWKYSDPALAYERSESRTCKGCQHESVAQMFGEKFRSCSKNRAHGKRCKFYIERVV